MTGQFEVFLNNFNEILITLTSKTSFPTLFYSSDHLDDENI